MKHEINGRIVGHQLFHPDPKDAALELAKVLVDVQPVGDAKTEKNSRCVFIVEIESLDGFPLQGSVRIQIEDVQQNLALGRATQSRRREREAHARHDA